MHRSEKKGFSGDFITGPKGQFPLANFDGSIEATRNCVVCFETLKSEFWTFTFELEKIESFKIESIRAGYKKLMKYNELSDTLLVYCDGQLFNINMESKTVVWCSSFMEQHPNYGTFCNGIAVDSRGIIYVCMSRDCPAILYVLTHNGAVLDKVGNNTSTRRIEFGTNFEMGMDGEENIVITAHNKVNVVMKISKMLKQISKKKATTLYFTCGPLIYDSINNHFLNIDYNGINVFDMNFNRVAQHNHISPYQVALANNGIIYQVCSGGSAYDTIKSFQ